MQSLEDVVRAIPDFSEWTYSHRIRLVGWYLHAHQGRSHFGLSDIRRQYDDLHVPGPSNWSQLLTQLVKKGDLLKTPRGLMVTRPICNEFASKYGSRPSTIALSNLLSDVAVKIPALAEREFLSEVMSCLRAEAFRSAIVMAWNLAYDHLAHWILKNHLAEFNDRWPIRFERHHSEAKIKMIVKRDDFNEFKESQVLEICRSAGMITADLKNLMDEKLDKRNSAAHPSGLLFTQMQAEAYVEDLVLNVVLKLV